MQSYPLISGHILPPYVSSHVIFLLDVSVLLGNLGLLIIFREYCHCFIVA